MEILITIVHVTTCLVLILAVLLQSGKGGGMGAGLGGAGGAGGQIFGGRGASSFLTRVTTAAALIFFVTSMTLAGLGSREESTGERLLRERQNEENISQDTATSDENNEARTAEESAMSDDDDAADDEPESETSTDPASTSENGDESDLPTSGDEDPSP